MADAGPIPETGTNGGRSNGHLEEKVIEEWRNAAYNCFSSGHKFCREVCPVMQVTRDERHTPTAFHANVVAMDKGLLGIEDVAEDYVHCTQCGACELRCPNTLFTGDFYRFRQRTVDVVKAMRALASRAASSSRAGSGGTTLTDERRQRAGARLETSSRRRSTSATGRPGSTSRPAARPSSSATARRRSTAPPCRARSRRSCRRPASSSGSCASSGAAAGPAAEMGYVDQAQRFAEHNVERLARRSARSGSSCLDPHDYITFTEDYPTYFGDDFDEFEIVLGRRARRRADPGREARADRPDRARRSPTTMRAG